MSSNNLDLDIASSLAPPLRSRLKLTREKLESLSTGLKQLATSVREDDHVKRTVRKTLVGHDLVLTQQKVPIGVLLVIFESRPDCLIQVRLYNRPVSSCNLKRGVLLKKMYNVGGGGGVREEGCRSRKITSKKELEFVFLI